MNLKKKTHIKFKKVCNHTHHYLKNGSLGIKSLSYSRISKKQWDQLTFVFKQKIKKDLKSKVKIWNCLNCTYNTTQLSLASRMGKGKGNFIDSVCFVTPGAILYEITGAQKVQLIPIWKNLSKLLPLKITVIDKYNN